MTSNKSKRALLGFEDSEDEVEQTPVQLTKRAKVPKPIFRPFSITETPPEDASHKKTRTMTFTQASATDNDDYLKMAITEDVTTGPQKLNKAAVESEATPDTLTRLKTSLFGQLTPDDAGFTSVMIPLRNVPLKSKGLKMMEKMGFKVGDTLGKDSHNKDALLEPILVIPRGNKGGIRTGEKEEGQKKKEDPSTEENEDEFKKWNQEQKKQAKLERTVRKMQKQCFEFEEGDTMDIEKVHLKDLNVMWRGYVKSVQEAIKKRREEKLPVDQNGDRFKEVGSEENGQQEVQDGHDEELEMFEDQSLEQKMTTLNAHLRSEHDYCFFCGVKYADQGDLFANCPGNTDEEHL